MGPQRVGHDSRTAAACTEAEMLGARVPSLRATDWASGHIGSSCRLEIKCTVNSACLNHAETILPNPGPWKNPLSGNLSRGQTAGDPV